jgi:hypothetical protein
LESLGHVVSTDDVRTVKLPEAKPGRRRRKGSLRLRWMEDEQDLRNMSVKRWRRNVSGHYRMGVCHKEHKVQTQRIMLLQKNKVLLAFSQGSLVLPCAENVKTKGYRTVILTVVLYGCGVWCDTSRAEHRLMAFEDRECSAMTQLFAGL